MIVSGKRKANSKEKKPKANDELLLIKMQKNAVFPQTDGKLSANPPLLVNFSLAFYLSSSIICLGLILSG